MGNHREPRSDAQPRKQCQKQGALMRCPVKRLVFLGRRRDMQARHQRLDRRRPARMNMVLMRNSTSIAGSDTGGAKMDGLQSVPLF
jgi:hypothetical protein